MSKKFPGGQSDTPPASQIRKVHPSWEQTTLHPSFTCIHHSFPNNATPSVSIYTHHSLSPSSPSLFMMPLSEPSIVVILLQRAGKQPIYFYNIYNNQAGDALTWLHNTPDLPPAWALAGDFNLHSLVWDENSKLSSHTKISQLQHITNALEVRLVSTPNVGTWRSDSNLSRETVIDLIWTTESLNPPYVDMSFENVGSSDHAILSAAINNKSPPIVGNKSLKPKSEENESFSTFTMEAILQLPNSYTSQKDI